MKTFLKPLIVAAALVLATLLPVKADSTAWNPKAGDLLANLGTVNVPASGSLSLLTNGTLPMAKVITVRHGESLALFPSFNLANAGSSTATVTFNFSCGPGVIAISPAYGVTNYIGTSNVTTINTNYTVSFNLSGANNQIGLYYLPAPNVDVGSFTIGSISTAANNSGGVNVSNIWWSKESLQP